jgi:hypothetical protein
MPWPLPQALATGTIPLDPQTAYVCTTESWGPVI